MVLDVRDVHVAFGATPVLAGVSLTVGAGEIVGLLGPSGSGKSTLLRVVAGLVAADAGTVLVDGRDVTAVPTHRRGIGMVFQDEQLFPHRDVATNVAFGLRMQRVGAAARTARVDELLTLVGLPGFGRRHVTELSGGEAKRVALARSLAPAPRVLLLDEPLSGLDRELHDRLTTELAAILRTAGTTTLLVTHDRDEVAAIADRVTTMTELSCPFQPAGSGRLERTVPSSSSPVVELAAAETHPLRAAVLRNDTPSRDVVLQADDDPATLHLGVRDADGEVVAVSTWRRRPAPDGAGDEAVQLRAMATDPALQGTGIGGRLLEAGLERAFAAGASVVWARARDTALGFYRRHGFEVVEPGFFDEATARPHHVVLRRRD